MPRDAARNPMPYVRWRPATCAGACARCPRHPLSGICVVPFRCPADGTSGRRPATWGTPCRVSTRSWPAFWSGDADAHGDARIAAYRAADVPSQLLQSSGFDAPQVEERLVDGVYLGGGNHAAERPDHAPRHVAVEVEITPKRRLHYAVFRGRGSGNRGVPCGCRAPWPRSSARSHSRRCSTARPRGRPSSSGRKTRSHEAKKLLQSQSPYIVFSCCMLSAPPSGVVVPSRGYLLGVK